MGESTGPRTLLSAPLHFLTSAAFRDCQFSGVNFRLSEDTSSANYSVNVDMNNNLSDRGEFYFSKWYYNNNALLTVNLWNNLFRAGSLSLNYDTSSVNWNPTWTVRDNAFDNLSVSRSGTGLANISHAHNAYINSTVMSGTTVSNVSLSTFTYASTVGGLGRWYHGQTDLRNVGSRTNTAAGLNHHTTETSRAKETLAVDIGFHYVATDTAGNPLDTDMDGIPDYVEDRNGNGSHDPATETNWNGYNSPNGLTSAPATLFFTPLR